MYFILIFFFSSRYQKKEIPNLNDIHFTAKLVGKLFKSTPEPIRTISFENYIGSFFFFKKKESNQSNIIK